jgi:F420-dependent oxidoreductase-like protein
MEHDHAMRFGLQVPNFSLGVPDNELFDTVTQLARTAEEVGFDSFWVMDHFYQLPALGGESAPMLESYTLLGGLAARTTRIRLGALVTGVTYRNPAILAKVVTTLDILSAGRAMLGIGAAWHDVEHVGLGVEFPPAGERLDRLEEAVQICRAMFREDHPTFEGRYYRIRDARNLPRPIQAGGPPILIGGGGEKRTLRLVARYADFCNITGDTDVIRHKIGVLHRHCEAEGRDPADVTVSRLSTLVLTDSAQATADTWELLRAAVGDDAAGFDVGEEDAIVTRIESLADAGVEYCIFNMPISGVDAVRQVGELLQSRFPSA